LRFLAAEEVVDGADMDDFRRKRTMLLVEAEGAGKPLMRWRCVYAPASTCIILCSLCYLSEREVLISILSAWPAGRRMLYYMILMPKAASHGIMTQLAHGLPKFTTGAT
jgi:hypothetical protein